ncbi:MAG: hypothetical protein E5V18_12525 [Mesorhizobium sp.]|nr:MAG: hypothetical protein E5V18_12525 [Mesorhizobium sp.]
MIQIIISSHAASLQRGYRWTASSRDAEMPPLTGVAGRLERALRNFLETFPVFVAAVFLGPCARPRERAQRVGSWSLSVSLARAIVPDRRHGGVATLEF